MAKSAKEGLPAQSPNHPVDSEIPPDGENIDKIRDILFGSQSRQIEKKLSAVEEKIEKEIDSLRSETKSTLGAFEQFVRKELQSLSDQLSSEKSDRTESVESLSDRITDAKKNVEKELSQFKDKVVKDQRETQEQILLQAKNLLKEMGSEKRCPPETHGPVHARAGT